MFSKITDEFMLRMEFIFKYSATKKKQMRIDEISFIRRWLLKVVDGGSLCTLISLQWGI